MESASSSRTPSPPVAGPGALLFVEAALEIRVVSARQAATAVLAAWEGRLPGIEDPRAALIRMASLDAATCRRLDALVRKRLAAAGPDRAATPSESVGSVSDAPLLVRRPSDDAAPVDAAVPLRPPPSGRYRDFVPIGQGGMGVVYAALDTEMNRTVAFKLLRPAAASGRDAVTPPAPDAVKAPQARDPSRERYEAYKTRFLQEAWVAGGMEHPGIVPVHEVGCTDAGVPYYTMRLVRGHRTLATALEEIEDRRLEDRLPLLEPWLRACDAVRYAHSQGVLHRDLKPANIALGEYGETFVVDWGLARLTLDGDGDRSGWHEGIELLRRGSGLRTGHGVVGTVGYAAPEALGGDLEKVTHRSDVYSLGVILFEILTGRLPFDPRDEGRVGAQVRGEAAADPRDLDADVPRALAILCREVLDPDPARRPQDVAALVGRVRAWQSNVARDRQIGRWLEEAEVALGAAQELEGDALLRHVERATTACRRVLERVPAHADARALLQRGRDLAEAAVATRAAAWRRRQMRRVGVAALVVLVVIGVVVSILLEGRRREAESARSAATQARAAATRHRERAEVTMGFMLDDLRAELRSMGRLDLLADLGRHARDHYRRLPAEEDTEETFRRRVASLHELGDVYVALGRLPEARELFEEAHAIAEDRRARTGDTAAAVALRRAEVHLADVDRLQGFAHRALERLDDAVPALERLAGSATPTAVDALLEARRVEGRAARVAGRYERAAQALHAALAAADGRSAEDDRTRAETRIALARLAFQTGGASAAQTHVEDVVSTARRLVAEAPDDVPARALLGSALAARARVEERQGEHEAAQTSLDEALALYEGLAQNHPENLRWQSEVARLLVGRGDLRFHAGESGAAAPDYARAHDLALSLVERDPTNAIHLNLVITTCDRRAVTSPLDLALVQAMRRTAVSHARALYALDPSNSRWKLILAFTLRAGPTKGGPSARIATLREARALAREVLHEIPGPADVPAIFVNATVELAELHVAQGHGDVAHTLARETVDDLLALSRSHPDASGAWRGLQHAVTSLAPALADAGADGLRERDRQAHLLVQRVEEALAGDDLEEATRADLEDRLLAARRHRDEVLGEDDAE